MLKRNYAWIFLLFAVTVFVVSKVSDSWIGPKYSQGTNCSATWGQTCNTVAGGNDDAFDYGGVCSGSRKGSAEHVEEVYLNQTYAITGKSIEATCQFREFGAGTEEYIYYFNGTSWSQIYSGSTAGSVPRNITRSFTVNNTEGMHIVRCIIDLDGENDECANVGNYYDNDDANFTAVAPLDYNTWGLSVADGAAVYRWQNVTAYANWSKNPYSANITHNGTGSFAYYSVAPSGAWTNYTLHLANSTEFNNTGLISVSAIYAVDQYEQGNLTVPSKFFYLWSAANLTDISFSDAIIYNGTSTRVNCRVADVYSGSPVHQGYNVSFWSGASYLNSSLTNSSGWANITYADSTVNPPQNVTIKCNITGMASLYYNASSELNATFQAVDIRANIASISDAVFGSNVTIRVNVTGNASDISWPVGANITFYNYSSNQYVNPIAVTLSPVASYPGYTEYSGTYSTVQSGLHNVTVYAYAERAAYNSTQFNVSYGAPSISFAFPNFRVMVNQSFNFTVNLSSITGDVVNPVLVLGFTNESIMNVSAGENFTRTLVANITNGSVVSFFWNATTKKIGLLRANVSITLVKGTNSSFDAPFSALAPIASVVSSSINITQNETLVVKIVGNASAIQLANFTVVKPYGGGSSTITAAFFNTDTESNCVGLGEGAGNIAVGANTSCSGGTCANAVDNNTLSSWARYSPSWITVNLSQKYMVDTIEVLWQGGATNTSMFYKRSFSSTAMGGGPPTWDPIQNFQNQDAPGEEGTTVIKPGNPFETDTLLVNDSTSGGFNIYELRIYAVEGRVGQCHIYHANYASVNSSGTHNVSVGVRTGSSTEPSVAESSFFVQFGVPVVSNLFEGTQIIGARTFSYGIYAQYGDLRNITAVLSLPNPSIINFSAGETNSKNSSYISSGSSGTVSWSLNATAQGDANMSVFANSTTGLGGSGSNNATITVILEDNIKPNISWFLLSGNATNLLQSISVAVNASDNYLVKNIIAEVTAPSFSFNQTNSTDPKISGIWTILLNSSLLNQTGNYSVKIYAEDLNASNIVYNATLLNFTVTSAYSVFPNTNYSAYNRGENATFRAYDANNNTVSGVSWIVNESYVGGNITANATTIFEGIAGMFVYTFTTNKTPGIYYLEIYTNKSGNTGNYTGNITSSSELNLIFIRPPGTNTYTAGESIFPVPRVAILSVHNVSIANLTNDGGAAYLYCPGSPGSGVISLIYEYNYFYGSPYGNRTYTIDSNLYSCKASPYSQTQFFLAANATDKYNNSVSQNSSILYTGGGSYAPGGSGGGGGGIQRIIINETQNASVLQKIYNYNFSLDSQEMQVMQGREATVIASVSNTGDFDMTLAASNSDTILAISYTKEIFLAKSADIDIPIKIRSNLTTKPGEYFMTIYLSGHSIEKNRAIKITVVENPDIPAINNIVAAIDALKARLKEYAALGIDVSAVYERINSTEKYLASAEDAAAIGKMDYFSLAVKAAEVETASAESELKSYGTKKFLAENNSKISIFASLSVTFIIILFVFLAPYTELSRKLYLLRRQEKILIDTRKSSENQYFMRKIDEATFHKIMIDEQDKLYKTRSEAKRLEEELGLLKRLKFSEIRKAKNEWKQRMAEAQKARLMQAAKEGGNTHAAAGGKKTNLFRRVMQKIMHPFRKNATVQ